MTKLMVMDIIDMERVEAEGEIVEFIVQQDQSVGGWLTVGEGSHTVHKNISSDLQGIVSCSQSSHPTPRIHLVMLGSYCISPNKNISMCVYKWQ